jgi:hypothetical protein
MIPRPIILLALAASLGCQQVPSQEPPPTVSVMGPPAYGQPAEQIIPGATIITETETIERLAPDAIYSQAAPYPTPGMVVPQHVYPVTPAPAYGQPYGPYATAPLAAQPFPGQAIPGQPIPGQPIPGQPIPGQPIPLPPQSAAPPAFQNPIHVPVANDEQAWEEIADVTSDYFQIARERRARRGIGIQSEGFIETVPLGGATILEPHRPDSVGDFNRWESTLQTIRRRAIVRVTPDAGGYLVGIEVQKELEDLPRPEQATAGASTLRTDGSLPPRDTYDISRTRESLVWIPLGRDPALEQEMLEEIRVRLAGPAGAR